MNDRKHLSGREFERLLEAVKRSRNEAAIVAYRNARAWLPCWGVTARLMASPLLPSPPIRGVTEPEGSQTMTQETKASRFALKSQQGQIVATPGAIEACSPQHLSRCLYRHSSADWGLV